jgi:hypothetical protein
MDVKGEQPYPVIKNNTDPDYKGPENIDKQIPHGMKEIQPFDEFIEQAHDLMAEFFL